MPKITRFFIGLMFMCLQFSFVQAQTTILDQTMLTQSSFNTFTVVNVTGPQQWGFNSLYGAVCSGYANGQSYQNEDWLISPVMNLSQMNNVQLNFSHTRGNAEVMNVGVNQGWYKAYATSQYSGDPATTNWIELEGLNQYIPEAWQFVSSGSLTIPEAAQSSNSRIAFRYISSSSASAMWEIKNIKVTGFPEGTNPGTNVVFKITNWNTEWLGCETFGPENENLQINNVADAMLAMNSDIYCLQEVSNTSSNPSVETLVSLMGSAQWGGAIAPANTGDCNQRQAIIYKKSKVQLVSASEMLNGNAAQGNSYYYNWSSGRYPALYNVNLVAGSTLIPVSLVNIHAKAEDGNPTSYTRRKGGSEGLKALLDGSNYNTKNVIVIGDFNDYLIGTTSEACNCTDSPFKNFMNDQANYTGITSDITDADTSWGLHPIIENIIISNELDDNYIANSALQEEAIAETISGFYYNTSNHLPVTALFQFSALSNPEFTKPEASFTLYPNPVKDELTVTLSGLADDTDAAIYDLTGRQVLVQKLNGTTINVGALPSGIYIVRINNSVAKFVKE
ncbi:T9SS type A sorting domain-containing protein [Flavobacterium sp. D11R37]|uniref:T9SS-dependent choice-of-anchor J family protein n=1 Tax=Flavobacterium coralii TaxID=2838017 RepID=UPI001CA6275E|nr:T9SS type A sorting domain-containing protein [Flavobacterium coralii]MBY8963527.1 T9SS type A sorting domain-containing protein [Flavobacterium coralii]